MTSCITGVKPTVRDMHGICCAGRGRGREAAEQAAAEAARQAALLSHADLVASTRKIDGPISIGGTCRALNTAYAALSCHLGFVGFVVS